MHLNFNDTAIRERIVFIISDLLKNNMIKSKAQLAGDVCVSPQQLNEIDSIKIAENYVIKNILPKLKDAKIIDHDPEVSIINDVNKAISIKNNIDASIIRNGESFTRALNNNDRIIKGSESVEGK